MLESELRQYTRQTVLRILADCGGYLLPEPRLIDHMQAAVMPPPTRSECDQEIQWLDDNGYIAGVTPELGGPRKWKLTDKGRISL
jgi:hypothetical protein